MTNKEENKRINNRLQEQYISVTDDFLAEWKQAFPSEVAPSRINEFGIIDEERYDTDNGILFIGKETNGWSNEDYENGCLFRGWMEDISRNGLEGRGHIKKHPNMWYNIGRWATLIEKPDAPLNEIASMRNEAIRAIGKIAFTNVNKVRGYNSSRGEYQLLAYSPTVVEILKREIAIINPKVIVCCGTCRPVMQLIPEYKGKIILMPHSGARKKTIDMLLDLQKQLNQLKEESV